MFGPLFHYELVRLARRGRSTVLRCAYALAVFVALGVAYYQRFPGHSALTDPFATPEVQARDSAALAEDFVRAMLLAQAIAVAVLTPAYLAGAIAGERERGTLELLFTTHLTDREIVLGKLAAGVTHLAGILLAALPLLAITQLWGGVDIFLLLAAFLAALLNLIAVGSLCVWCSATSPTVAESLVKSYMLSAYFTVASLALPYVSAASSYGLFEALRYGAWWGAWPGSPSARSTPDGFWPVFVCLAVNGLVALVHVTLAVANLRPSARPETVAPRAGKPKRKPAAARPPEPLPPVGDWPLLWREMTRDGQRFPPRFGRLLARAWPALAILSVVAGRLFLTDAAGQNFAGTAVALVSVFALVVFGVVWCTLVTFQAAASVCRERDQKTLDVLLTLPVSRAGVLGAKWLGAILASRIGYVLIFGAALNVGSRALSPPRALLLTLLLAAQVAFLAGLGVRVSVASRTTTRARVIMSVLFFLFFGGAWMASGFDSRAGEALENARTAAPGSADASMTRPRVVRALVYDVAANPIRGWMSLTIGLAYPGGHPSDERLDAARHVTLACAALAYALAAAVLWLDAWRCFRAERRR
jgi:ABC-type transport system involved in multi-copper enzyme maturation permease subunit